LEPTVPKGSLCLIKKTDFDGVKSGDVILFKNGDTIVLHRLIEKDADYGITKGDANNAADGISVTRSQNNVMGKLVFAIPLVGAFFYSIYGKVLICVVIFLILYFGIFHDKDDEEDDTEESCENQTI
jgi:signal peptidase I